MKIVKGVYDQSQQMVMYRALCEVNRSLGLLWLLGCSTGYRVSDLLSTRSFCIISGTLRLVEGKTGKIRRMNLPSCVYGAVNDQISHFKLEPGALLFFSTKDRGRPISRQHVHRVFKETAEKLGMTGIGTHSMRKTYAYNVLLATKSFQHVQITLNHTYLSTTFLYLIDGLAAILPKPDRKGIPPASIVATALLPVG